MNNSFPISGYTINPYFNSDPASFYMVSLKVLAILTAVVAGFALYTVLFKSPKILSKTFIALTIYHIIIGLLLLIHMSALSTLFMYLPYIALKCVGVYSDLGIPTAVQIGILVTLIFDMASAAVPLFYYRMDVLLPPGHVLNSKCLRYFIYICVYGLFNIIPVPLFCLIVAYDSQYDMKRRIFQSMGVYYEDFMSDWIIIMEMNGSNPFFNFLSYGLVPYMCVFNVSIAVTSSYVILKLTSNVGIIGSAKYKAQQRQLFFSLATMTIVVLPVVGCLFPIAVYLIFSNSYRVDIVNTLIVTCFSSIPIGFLLYGISYRPYRQFVLSLFFKRPAPLSPFVVARPTKPTM